MMGDKKQKKVFGLYEIDTVNAVNRLLKDKGLKLRVKKDYRNWGDQIEITVESLQSQPDGETEQLNQSVNNTDRK